MGIAKRKAATKKLLATLCFFKKCLPKKYIPTIGPKKAKAVIVIKNIALILGVSIREVTKNRRDMRYKSEENFEAVYSENADEAYFADLAGGQYLEVLGAGVTSGGLVGECDAVVQMHYLAVAFPEGNVDWVAAVEHR